MTPHQFKVAQVTIGMDNATLAAALGVTSVTVSNWRRGHTPIPGTASIAMRALAAGFTPPREGEAG